MHFRLHISFVIYYYCQLYLFQMGWLIETKFFFGLLLGPIPDDYLFQIIYFCIQEKRLDAGPWN